ncbi:MAG: TetR/AcrR family transcriptional regulator [Flavobacteriaceae bacterium]|nr:TetR/AcrR family transcriptional regulator [Flavobacteriaceae bacterium]
MENNEHKILEAAKTVFQKKGMTGARMQEIADEAGINKALLHYYYRSKQMLFEAVFFQAFSLIAPKLGAVLNSEIALFDKIKHFTKGYISFAMAHPYVPKFIIQELNQNPDFAEKLVQHNSFPNIDIFKNQIETAVKNGKIRTISPEQLFINIMSLTVFPFIGAPLLKGFTKLNEADYKVLIEERKTMVADFIINAIKK